MTAASLSTGQPRGGRDRAARAPGHRPPHAPLSVIGGRASSSRRGDPSAVRRRRAPFRTLRFPPHSFLPTCLSTLAYEPATLGAQRAVAWGPARPRAQLPGVAAGAPRRRCCCRSFIAALRPRATVTCPPLLLGVPAGGAGRAAGGGRGAGVAAGCARALQWAARCTVAVTLPVSPLSRWEAPRKDECVSLAVAVRMCCRGAPHDPDAVHVLLSHGRSRQARGLGLCSINDDC